MWKLIIGLDVTTVCEHDVKLPSRQNSCATHTVGTPDAQRGLGNEALQRRKMNHILLEVLSGQWLLYVSDNTCTFSYVSYVFD